MFETYNLKFSPFIRYYVSITLDSNKVLILNNFLANKLFLSANLYNNVKQFES
jgi:hypothetical protein